jgi:DNA helicase-2/ATP-dependent DNA helicase PcrA
LTAIAEQAPADLSGLLEIPGIGPKKLEAHGAALLALVAAYSA